MHAPRLFSVARTTRELLPAARRVTFPVVLLLALSIGCGDPDDASNTSESGAGVPMHSKAPETIEVEVSAPDTAVSESRSPSPEDRSATGPFAVKIVDGDTLVVAEAGGEETVRLIGVNTPESGECFADEATDALTGLVAGVSLVLVSDESDRDQYDRLLRYVETAEGTDVGGELVAGGFAIARRYEPDVARDDRYAELQEDAQAAERGLWAPDACGPALVERGVIEVEVNSDAPGNDNENLNGEWVRITNTSNEPLELKGWLVADESASHRYEFGNIVLEPGDEITLFTGCGVDTDVEVFWCEEGSAVWNNSGDSVIIRDPNGNLVLFSSYGDSS